MNARISSGDSRDGVHLYVLGNSQPSLRDWTYPLHTYPGLRPGLLSASLAGLTIERNLSTTGLTELGSSLSVLH
jgi:hypothetical protein